MKIDVTSFDGQKAVYIGIQVAPNANLLDVVKRVRDVFPSIQSQLPEGIDGKIVYDATQFVNSSIREVVRSLVEALLIVTGVVFVMPVGQPEHVVDGQRALWVFQILHRRAEVLSEVRGVDFDRR